MCTPRIKIYMLKNSVKAATAAAVLLGASAVAIAAEPDLVTPAVPAASVYLRTTAASVNLSSSGAPVTILKVTVPAGTWLVTAKANAVNFGAADYVRCLILVGTTQKDAGATLVGNAGPGPTGEEGPSVAETVLQTAVTTPANRSFSLSCQHDFAYPGDYLDPGALLLIVQAPGPLG
jgi:hypothetical protein